MGWIKSQVSKVIPSKVYEFAGLDPETGERLLPKASEESLRAISEAGLADAYMQAKNTGNADEMERLIRDAERMRDSGAKTTNNYYNNVDNRKSEQKVEINSQQLQDVNAIPG